MKNKCIFCLTRWFSSLLIFFIIRKIFFLKFFFEASCVYFGNSSLAALCTEAFSWKYWNYIKSAFGCHLLFCFSFILFPKLGRCCIKCSETVWLHFPCGASDKLEIKREEIAGFGFLQLFFFSPLCVCVCVPLKSEQLSPSAQPADGMHRSVSCD